MRKKKISGISLVLILIFNLLFFSVSFGEVDEEAIFKERLSQAFSFFKNKGESLSEEDIKQGQYYLNLLWNFADEFPNSKYADDAQYIILILKSAKDIDIPAWEKFVVRFSSGKLEEWALGFLKDFNFVTFETYLPYELLLLNAKSMKALIDKDYENVIKYSSELVEKIDYNEPNLKEAIWFNYFKILVSYKYLNKKEDYEKVKEKIILIFPERKDKIEKIWQ